MGGWEDWEDWKIKDGVLHKGLKGGNILEAKEFSFRHLWSPPKSPTG
jgi:hypothetical protein